MKDEVFNLNLEDFQVGKPETRNVQFPSFYGLQKANVPLFVYRASKEISPCVVVTSCVHGDEINGLRISQAIIKSKLKLTKGTLIVLPVVNIYGFMNKQRYLPDRKDLNRCFPGLKNGSFGSRFAHLIFSNLTKYGDFFIDYHSGGIGRYNIPQIRCDFSNKQTEELVKSISIPLVVNSSLRDGSFRGELHELGKPCIVFEGGEGLRVDETIKKYGLNLFNSVLIYLGMLNSKKKYNLEKVVIKKTKWIRAREGGILINKTHQGKIEKEGSIVGELRNITGDLITRIKMERDGVILGMSQNSMIMSGDALYNVGYLDDNITDTEEDLGDFFDLEDN